MLELRNTLKQRGWDLMSDSNLFSIEGERITWTLCHEPTGIHIDLEFYVCGDLGQRSDDLNDIVHCAVKGHDIMLSFVKKTNPKWKPKLATFVESVCAIATP